MIADVKLFFSFTRILENSERKKTRDLYHRIKLKLKEWQRKKNEFSSFFILNKILQGTRKGIKLSFLLLMWRLYLLIISFFFSYYSVRNVYTNCMCSSKQLIFKCDNEKKKMFIVHWILCSKTSNCMKKVQIMTKTMFPYDVFTLGMCVCVVAPKRCYNNEHHQFLNSVLTNSSNFK